MTTFHRVLANNLVANITNYTVWFALTFRVFLVTRSMFASGMIAGVYLVLARNSDHDRRLSEAYPKWAAAG